MYFTKRRLREIVEKHCGIEKFQQIFFYDTVEFTRKYFEKVLDGYLSGDDN